MLAWLGLSFLGSTRLDRDTPVRLRLALALLFGLGPLVRPDLVIPAAIWIGLLLAFTQGWLRRAACLAAALSLPFAYQIFRMGYFAALVPNTAIAKEASRPYWSQGLAYLRDFVQPYHLGLGLALFAAAFAALCAQLLERGQRRTTVIAAAPVLAGVLQGLFVVWVGGDFMHARMLLPPLFALGLPVAVFAAEDALSFGIGGLAICYAAGCLFAFRVPYDRWAKGGKGYIGNERGIYVTGAKKDNPVELADYRAASWAANGTKMAKAAEGLADAGNPEQGEFSDGFKTDPHPAHLATDSTAPLVAFRPNVGEFSFAAGPLVFVCDPHGLPDPIGARLRLQKRAQPGHEKWAGQEWCIARRLAANESGGISETKVGAARAALDCGDLAELMRAVDGPLTLGRFVNNMLDAPRLTRLRIPATAEVAERELCGETFSQSVAPASSPASSAPTSPPVVRRPCAGSEEFRQSLYRWPRPPANRVICLLRWPRAATKVRPW